MKSFIGKDANESINQIKERLNYQRVTDCIGIMGYRNITMICGEWRIDIVCETSKANEVLNESIAPSEVNWRIIDIFEYEDKPTPGKGYYY